MRLVDINFKNINGQASDIRGNINVIGHLLAVPLSVQKVPVISGYFEVDGSIITNAKDNYPELHSLLENTDSASIYIAKLINGGDDILLASKSGTFFSKGSLIHQGLDGLYQPALKESHTHSSFSSGGATSSPAETTRQPAYYTVRYFIYHGVHV